MPCPTPDSTDAIEAADQATRATGADLRTRYRALEDRVTNAAARAGRTREDVIVVLVSKYGSIEQIRELIAMGHRDFGENRAQQLGQRVAQIAEWCERLADRPDSAPIGGPIPTPDEIRWHMIGHLQRNKVRKAIECARLIHSVDSLRLAEEIQATAMKTDSIVDVLVQVNVADESQKSGVAPAAARHLIDQLDTMASLRARGLMCMAPLSDDPDAPRRTFDRCRELFTEIHTSGAGDGFQLLSMGMSGDFETAIECGANVVRVGSAVFRDAGREADRET